MPKKQSNFKLGTYARESLKELSELTRYSQTECVEAAVDFLLKQPEHKVIDIFYKARQASAEREVKELGKNINDFVEDV